MAQLIQAIRGMNDILPNESYEWQTVEALFRNTLQCFAYQEIRFPIVEKTDLFKRSIGEVTDIVEKEMYTFLDRNEDSLSLRPEGTACCVRAGIEHGLLYNQIQRLWYTGPFFRHERPQKGRYRQFHQCSAEVLGLSGPDIDAELIALSAILLKRLGLASATKLQINSLGTAQARNIYRTHLINYLTQHKHELDEDSQKRLDKNPLRILDSKNPNMQKIIHGAPKLTDHLDKASHQHFEQLQFYLLQAGIPFEINSCLVRGLDYYSHTVFEWVTDELGAQGTICAGGRYDTLVEQLGGKATPAVGFSFGLERTILLRQKLQLSVTRNAPFVYLITDGDKAFAAGLKLANFLRERVAHLSILLHCGGGSIKNQFKKADKSGAHYAIVLGEHELNTKSAILKNLRQDIPQQTLLHDELAEYLDLKVKEARKAKKRESTL